jgi:hypothetical protein
VDIIAIGEPGLSTSTGGVKVWKLETGVWVLQGSQLLGNGTYSYFGQSVDLNEAGNIVVIGAHGYNSSRGIVGLYKLISNVWTVQGAHINGDTVGSALGYSVSINNTGDIIAIGAYGFDNRVGYIKVYKLTGTTWEQLGIRITGEAQNERFGWSVSINGIGDMITVGAYAANTNKGYVKIYK